MEPGKSKTKSALVRSPFALETTSFRRLQSPYSVEKRTLRKLDTEGSPGDLSSIADQMELGAFCSLYSFSPLEYFRKVVTASPRLVGGGIPFSNFYFFLWVSFSSSCNTWYFFL